MNSGANCRRPAQFTFQVRTRILKISSSFCCLLCVGSTRDEELIGRVSTPSAQHNARAQHAQQLQKENSMKWLTTTWLMCTSLLAMKLFQVLMTWKCQKNNERKFLTNAWYLMKWLSTKRQLPSFLSRNSVELAPPRLFLLRFPTNNTQLCSPKQCLWWCSQCHWGDVFYKDVLWLWLNMWPWLPSCTAQV